MDAAPGPGAVDIRAPPRPEGPAAPGGCAHRAARCGRSGGARGGFAGSRRALIARGTLPHLRHLDFGRFRQALDDLYRDSSYAPQWLAASSTTHPVLAELAAAPSHGPGINPCFACDLVDTDGKIVACDAGGTCPAKSALGRRSFASEHPMPTLFRPV